MSGQIPQHTLGHLHELHLGSVLENADPENRGRIKVQLHSIGLQVWASVIVASAGNGYGVSQLPRIGEQVVIAFISPDLPMVIGAVWSGGDSHPGDAAPVDERYLLQTPAGLKVLLDDNEPKVKITTPAGYHLTITDAGGGSIMIERSTEKIEMNSTGIKLTTSAKVEVQASQVDVSAGLVNVSSGLSKFSGVVQCDALITNSVISSSYTPGAGNIW